MFILCANTNTDRKQINDEETENVEENNFGAFVLFLFSIHPVGQWTKRLNAESNEMVKWNQKQHRKRKSERNSFISFFSSFQFECFDIHWNHCQKGIQNNGSANICSYVAECSIIFTLVSADTKWWFIFCYSAKATKTKHKKSIFWRKILYSHILCVPFEHILSCTHTRWMWAFVNVCRPT